MKRLLLVSLLVMVFAAGTAHAQQYEVAPCGTKDFTTIAYVVPGGTVCFDIWLTDANAPQFDGGAWLAFTSSTADIAYVSGGRCLEDGSEGCVGPWTAGVLLNEPAGVGTVMYVVANPSGAAPDGDGDLIVGTVTLQNLGPGAADATVDIICIPSFCEWTTIANPDVGAGTIIISEVCDCTTDADCDDEIFCNGAEVCDPICECNAGTLPCDDGVRCTLDYCDEDTDSCHFDECDISALSCYTAPCLQSYPCSDSVACILHCDADCDLLNDASDNCPNHPNYLLWGTCTAGESHKIARPCMDNSECGIDGFCSMNQEDTDGDEIGDACEICEADFDCDGNVDATDVTSFLGDFGRSVFCCPCTNADPCNGDFNCDVNVAADDVTKFLEDFGRSQFNNPCPPCVAGPWCIYP
jgi:hypothetical protein